MSREEAHRPKRRTGQIRLRKGKKYIRKTIRVAGNYGREVGACNAEVRWGARNFKESTSSLKQQGTLFFALRVGLHLSVSWDKIMSEFKADATGVFT